MMAISIMKKILRPSGLCKREWIRSLSSSLNSLRQSGLNVTYLRLFDLWGSYLTEIRRLLPEEFSILKVIIIDLLVLELVKVELPIAEFYKLRKREPGPRLRISLSPLVLHMTREFS